MCVNEGICPCCNNFVPWGDESIYNGRTFHQGCLEEWLWDGATLEENTEGKQ